MYDCIISISEKLLCYLILSVPPGPTGSFPGEREKKNLKKEETQTS